MPSFPYSARSRPGTSGCSLTPPQGAASPVASAGLGFFDRDVSAAPSTPLPVLDAVPVNPAVQRR